MNIFPAVRDGDWLRVNQYALRAPDGVDGALNVAVRPEDITVSAPTASPNSSAMWHGTIDQLVDLGHYRRALVLVPSLFKDESDAAIHRLKVYMPKATGFKEGDQVALYPSRYLVYSDKSQPIEVLNQPFRSLDENRRDDLSRTAVSAGD
jgi:hypothetical protein